MSFLFPLDTGTPQIEAVTNGYRVYHGLVALEVTWDGVTLSQKVLDPGDFSYFGDVFFGVNQVAISGTVTVEELAVEKGVGIKVTVTITAGEIVLEWKLVEDQPLKLSISLTPNVSLAFNVNFSMGLTQRYEDQGENSFAFISDRTPYVFNWQDVVEQGYEVTKEVDTENELFKLDIGMGALTAGNTYIVDPTLISSGSGSPLTAGSRLVVRSSSKIYVAIKYNSTIYRIYESVDGSSWAQSTNASWTVGSTDSVSIAIDSSNVIHILYNDIDTSNRRVEYRTYTISTSTLSSYTTVETAGSGCLPGKVAIAVDSSDYPRVAYGIQVLE